MFSVRTPLIKEL